MPKTPLTEREIHVYTCMTDPSRKALAVIDGWNMNFYGDTPLKARNAADAFRKEAVANDKLMARKILADQHGDAVQ